jgi:hypothetical protein
MADGQPAEGEFGEEGLHVAQVRLAAGGIAVMADGAAAFKPCDNLGRVEIITDKAKRTVGKELAVVVAHDAGGLLPAML